jgi:hypothetical protein
MRHSPLPFTSRPGRRGGLALPTALAAAVCGSSVLVIAATGTVALAGSDRLAVEILSPTDPVGERPTRPTSVGERISTARPTLSEARTAVEFVVDGPAAVLASGSPSRPPEPAAVTTTAVTTTATTTATTTVTVTATISAVQFRGA